MEQSALESNLSWTADSGTASTTASALRTLLFSDRIPEFAQSQWQALRRSSPWVDDLLQPALGARQLYTYALQRDGETVALYFFRLEKHTALVLNREGNEAGRDLYRFSHYLFHRFPRIKEIRFHASQHYIYSPSRFSRKTQSGDRIMLPAYPSSQLEQALRFSKRNVNYFLQRLERDFPSYRFECHANEAIEEKLCRAILHLQRPRLALHPQREARLDEAQEDLIRGVRTAGLVVALTIGGKLAAGLICQQVGQEMHLRFLAHDPWLQAYGLGMLCCYFAVCTHLDRHRKKKSRPLSKPRYAYALALHQQTVTAMRLYRPHASWLVRCDVAIYRLAMAYWTRYLSFRDDCVQLGTALIRLAGAGKLLFQSAHQRRARQPQHSEETLSYLRGQ